MDKIKEKIMRTIFVYEGDEKNTLTPLQYLFMFCFGIAFVALFYYLV
nr:hypothetical protein [Macrococcus goetzii]